MTAPVKIKSPAKVNLFLEVVGRRPDGYHNLETIFQEIDLCDELRLEEAEKGRIKLTTNSKDVPTDRTNLIYRAAEAFFKKTGVDQGVRIHLEKKIPVAAGLGGGSGNAAATLKGLQRLFNISLPDQTFLEISRTLGADVGFFLKGKTALGRGIGDELEPVKTVKPFFIVLVNPKFNLPTPEVYQGLDLRLTKPDLSISLIRRALEQGEIRKIGKALFNRLEDVVLKKFPRLAEIKKTFLEHGALGALLSGSGPTVFGMVETPEEAERLKQGVDQSCVGYWSALCRTV